MSELGRIIIADDEESFLKSTAYLLRQEGYHCDCAVDADAAEKALGANEYDLIISDIKMPGNAELEFVRSLPLIAKGMPVILVTAYPSLATAIESIQLPVVSYMVKPLDFGRLLDWVRIAMRFSDTYEVVNASSKRLEDWHEELTNLTRLMCRPSGDASEVSISAFLNLTLSNVTGALLDLKNLTEVIAGSQGETAACHLLNCPRPAALLEGIRETVAVLEKTKRSFKSKDLAQLRERLTTLAHEAGEA
ncbi:MAG: response regulator [Phycisphaerae bacterium]|nr:response regulator [Phycisphaerae bacterium]